MEGDWRDELREKIRQIKAAGGPPPEGVTIGVKAQLSKAQFDSLMMVLGRLNDRSFGEAPAGTLELHTLSYGEHGGGRLYFHFRPAPPPEFSSSSGLGRSRDPSGKPAKVISGVDFNALPGRVFPLDRSQLDAMRQGKRADAVVPIPPEATIVPGDWVTFVEAAADPFGFPVNTPGGASLSVRLNRVRDEDYLWAGQRLHYIAWDPEDVTGQADPAPVSGDRGEGNGRGHG